MLVFFNFSRVSEVTLGPFLVLLGPFLLFLCYVLGTIWDSRSSSSFRAMVFAMVFPRPAAPIFCSVSRVSEATLDTFLVGFSD